MQTYKYPQYDETLYYKKLQNGLSVYLLPKRSFNKTFALFSTRYGSIDNHFTPNGSDQAIRVPDGIAHFLEHKLFEKEHGDVFLDFARNGAQTNAFTSQTQTAYLFSATGNIPENLEILLDFVQTPYFTEETVEKEKGIIAQEIEMYNDIPNEKLLYGLLENLYPDHPVSTDILGTIESIEQIQAEDLYTCYRTFYHPANMTLTLVGNFDENEIMDTIKANQEKKEFSQWTGIDRFLPDQDMSRIQAFGQGYAPIQKPKFILGIRGEERDREGVVAYRQAMALNMGLELLFGDTSETHLKLYNQRLVDDSFNYGLSFHTAYDYMVLMGDADFPEATVDALERVLADPLAHLDEAHFDLIKARQVGQTLKGLNSIETLALTMTNDIVPDANLFDLLPIMEDISFIEVKNIVNNYFDKSRQSVYLLKPETVD